MSANIHVKFNNGNTALVWTGAGMATLESLGLATRAWVERLQKQVDETTAELAAESELVAALQAELSRVTEAAARQVAEVAEETREACALVALDPTKWDADDVSTGYPEDVARDIRATPLGATPLRERISELEGESLAARRRTGHEMERAEAAEARVKSDATTLTCKVCEKLIEWEQICGCRLMRYSPNSTTPHFYTRCGCGDVTRYGDGKKVAARRGITIENQEAT